MHCRLLPVPAADTVQVLVVSSKRSSQLKRLVILLVFIPVLLAGCGLEKGYVYEKVDLPAHWTFSLEAHTTCEKVGKSTVCTTTYTTVPTFHPELLELGISNCAPSEQHVRTDCDTDEHFVNQEVCDRYWIGDYADLTNS